ncbi:MAG: ester cyclase [Chthonomonadales bacterium]|nr:ester cyclase [Chthonomonadales bacterium]
MAHESNKALVSEFVSRVLSNHHLDAVDQLVAADFTELDPLPGQRQGRDGLKEVLAGLLAAFPDMNWTVHEQIAEDEMVVTRFAWTGTHRGAFLGIAPTGRNVAVKGVVIDRVVAGRMQESRILMDTLGLMQQLGVVPME